MRLLPLNKICGKPVAELERQVGSCNSRDTDVAGASFHFGGSDVIDFLAYLLFFVVIAGCLWFLDSALKNESD